MKTAIQFAAAFIVLAVIYLFSGYQHHLKTVRLDPIPQIDTAPVPQPVAPVEQVAPPVIETPVVAAPARHSKQRFHRSLKPRAPVKRRARNVPADQTTRECRGLMGCLD